MATPPVEEETIRPRAAWYVVPAVLWLTALTLFVIALLSIAHVVKSGVDPIDNHALVDIDTDGLTFYTTGSQSKVTCVLTPPNGSAFSLDLLDVTLNITVDENSYHAIGVTPDDLPAGRYRFDCTPVLPRTTFGTGPRVDIAALATRALWGIFLPLVLGVIGLVVLIVVIVRRHGAKIRLRQPTPPPPPPY
jgi:hypothetical protein